MADGERDGGGRSQVQGTASFSKFMAVLQAVADQPGRLDFLRLTRALPYPRGTLYRIVAGLAAEGLVAETPGTGCYRLGPRLIELASRSWESSDLRTAAREHIEALRDATGETVHLAVLSGNGMVYIDKLESPSAVRMMSRIGTRVELYSTSVGKAYLAALPEPRRREVVESLDLGPRTPKTITDRARLYAELETTRLRGHATDDEENEPDIRCLGGAILDRAGEPVGGVSLSIPLFRFDEARREDYARLVRETVAAITRSLATLV